MRLSIKFTLTFLCGMGVVLAIFAYQRMGREIALFESDFRKDHEAMGRDLAAAVARIWHLAGEGPALAFVDETNITKSQVLIRWVRRGDAVPGDSLTEVSSATLKSLADADRVFSQKVELEEGPHLRTYVPTTIAGDWLGTLELVESMEGAREYVRSSLVRTILTTGIIVALTGLLAVLLGVWFVGRPVRLLEAKARQIANGDFSGELELSQSDELGDLAQEINAMSTHLADANRRIATETTARIQAIEQLRHADRLRTVGQLTSGIAHELGTPLNVAWERAKMISNNPESGPTQVTSARIVADQCAKMTAIIRQLLDFSRPRRPKVVSIDLRQVVRQTLSLLRSMLEKHGIAVELEGVDGPTVAALDVDQIQQVATNLVLNAVQAMPQGGRLSIAVGRRRCCYPNEQAGERAFVFFGVRDSGSGIAPENLCRVFEPFFTTKDVGEGTGLGLSVSLGIVEEHGGWIDVESPAGAGAHFTAYLPEEGPTCVRES